MKPVLWLAILSLGLISAGYAQPAAGIPPGAKGGEGPRVVELSLEPAPQPRPALRYRLEHGVLEQRPGNAALAYKTAMAKFAEAMGDVEGSKQARTWLEAPPDQFDAAEVRDLVDRCAPALQTFAQAASCEDCDWQLPLREEGFALVLPHLGGMRDMGRVLALRARLRIVEGQYDEALDDIRTGLTMAGHVGNSATLIEGLVGIAITDIMLDRIEELVDAPSAPNLYWALTELSSEPLFSFHDAMRWERSMLYVHAPSLAEIDRKGVTAEDYHRGLAEVMGLAGMVETGPAPAMRFDRSPLAGTALALAVYPLARRALVEQGHSPEAVEAMPVAEVVMRHIVGGYEYRRDEIFKWTAVPFPEAHRGMVAAQLELKEAMAEDPMGNFLPGLLLPAVTHASVQFTRIDRGVAALRCIEALRLHAEATGEGLPSTLDEVQVVPVPEDPLTGRPFVYQATPDGARLDALAIPGDRPGRGRSYHITMGSP